MSKFDNGSMGISIIPGVILASFLFKIFGPLPGLILLVAHACLSALCVRFIGKDGIIPAYLIVIAAFIVFIAYRTNSMAI